MSLSPTMRMFGTAINYEFGDVEETGILIAVDEILEDKRIRHIQTFIESHPDALRLSSCEEMCIRDSYLTGENTHFELKNS